MKRKGFFVSLIAVILILSVAASGFAAQSKGPAQQALSAFDQKIVSNVDVTRALEHIRYMSKEIGSRPGGLENEKIAAAHIENYLKDLGYGTTIQEFGVPNQTIGNITVVGAEQWFGRGDWGFQEWHGTVWETGAAPGGLITGDGPAVSGFVIDCGVGNDGDFPQEVMGNIALVQRGTAFDILRDRAKAAGAAGLMIYSVAGSRGNYGQTFNPGTTTDIPVLGLALAQGMWLKEMSAEFPVRVNIQTWTYTGLTSQNVIAVKPAKAAGAPIVVVGGHYDSVLGSPGANDNLSGTAVVMELARVLKDKNTDNYELRFVLWGSEERGLRGARWYVNTLSSEEKARHYAKFNVDMVATSEYDRAPYFFVETVDGLPNIVSEASLAAAARLGYAEVRQSRFGSSDHVPFHDAGIPAALFIWLGGEGTPQNYTIERFYHTPQDTIEENICPARLQLALEVIGAAVFDMVRKPVPALQKAAIRR